MYEYMFAITIPPELKTLPSKKVLQTPGPRKKVGGSIFAAH